MGAGNGAVLVVDRATLEVLVLAGSTSYFAKEQAGAIDYTRIARSPGSALKPFVYALALDAGVITPATILDDVQRAPGEVGNVDASFLGPLLPRVALGNSRNVPAVLLVDRMGVDSVYRFFARLGLHDGRGQASTYGAGLAIGALPVTLEGVVRAYGVLANDGWLRDLVWLRVDSTGQPESGLGERVVSEATARQITSMLSDSMARLPTFPRLNTLEMGFPVAIKTGTSSNCRDAWAVGYSRKYLVGAWVGHPDNRPMRDIGGAVSAAAVVQRVLKVLHPGEDDGQSEVGFPKPRSGREVVLCSLSGEVAGDLCDRVYGEAFVPGTEPMKTCSVHRRLAVDQRNGMLATSATPRQYVSDRVFVDLPSRYAAWQESQGLPRPPDKRSPQGTRNAHWTVTTTDQPVLVEEKPPTIDLTSPEPGLHVVRDPDAPLASATLALAATVEPSVPQVVWYVDGKPFVVSDYPYAARWPLKEGRHTFQARLPFHEKGSPIVQVVVR
jgi:penicillin-binding protein 1C